jgi:anionic cell wall polymer biosynthesis LytR-Cps2A-Psr (LCP) family protein
LVADRYLAVNMSAFEDAIDAVGGIELCLDAPVDGTLQSLPYYGAGCHILKGADAVKFSRIRFPDTDFHRINRQTQVLMALRERALEPKNWVRLPGLVDNFMDEILTDLSLAEINNLICLLPKIDKQNILSLSIDRKLVTPTITNLGANILLPHEEQICELVGRFMRGELTAEDFE